MTIVISLLTLIYAAVLLWLFFGLGRLHYPLSDARPFVSVIVAARNEEVHMQPLLQALTKQSYPHDRYEIIIVNDQSTDRTAEIVQAFVDDRVRLLTTQNREKVISPKKNAIQLGILHAKGELIALTDADCLPPEGWLEGVMQLFTPEVGMVIGFSPCELPRVANLFTSLLALESISLAAVAAGTAGWGYAATCNGRNLAYRKQVYHEVGGFKAIEHFISGDDDMLLKLVQRTNWQIRYAYDARLAVPTACVNSLKHFANQRLRHASKGFHYEFKKTASLIVVYLYNLFVFASVPLSVFTDMSWRVPVVAIAIKALFEFFVVYRFASRMQRKKYLWSFLPAEVLHVPYVVIFGVAGPFLKFEWKKNGKSEC